MFRFCHSRVPLIRTLSWGNNIRRKLVDDQSTITPEETVIQAPEIDDRYLQFISDELEMKRLGHTTSIPNFPVQGKVFGDSYRVFFPLIISKRGIRITIPFLYNAGTNYTFIRRDTMKALGIDSEILLGAEVVLHGCKHFQVWESCANFQNVDVLGQDFLRSYGIRAIIEPSLLSATLVKIPADYKNG